VKRRAFLLAGLTLPLLAATPGAQLHRRAQFREVGNSVVMELKAPELLSKRDADAMASLSSGFATNLVYDVTLYKYVPGKSQPVRHTTRHVRIHYDYWSEKYVVETVDDGGTPGRLEFRLKEDAVKEVAKLRIRVAKASELERGDRNVYFVAIYAQRNPTKEVGGSPSAGTRGSSTDLRMFSRWVSLFMRSRLTAEKTMLLRTNFFYLVER
jgi:hypothetical protein